MRDREDTRAANIARDQADLPSATPDRNATGDYLYPVRGEHESLDERMLADLLRRVQRLEHMVAAQQEVVKALVTWRMAHARLPHAPGSTPGPVQSESRPGGQEEPEQGPGVLPDFLT